MDESPNEPTPKARKDIGYLDPPDKRGKWDNGKGVNITCRKRGVGKAKLATSLRSEPRSISPGLILRTRKLVVVIHTRFKSHVSNT